MPLTRHQRRLTDQNASQPIHRLSPELLSEIFLQARPNVLTEPEREGNVWAGFVRYLVSITSVSGYFRHVALDFGGLWTVVGFSLQSSDHDRCRGALVPMGAFLERAQKRKLHFYFDYPTPTWVPTWFHDSLSGLIGPHAGRVETLYFHQNHSGGWGHLRTLLNKVVNVNSLTVRFPQWMDTVLPPYEPVFLRHLRKLSLTNVSYGRLYFLELMKQVESLELRSGRNINIQQWLSNTPKLKRLILFGTQYVRSNTSHLLENLTHLQTNFRIYPSIPPGLSPQLRHLVVDMDSSSTPNLESQVHRHPSVRTLCMILGAPTVFHLRSAALFITMNPQLECLEFKWKTLGVGQQSCLLDLLSRVLLPTRPRGPTLPGEAPNFPGPSLKYLRLPYMEGLTRGEGARLSKQLILILLRAPGSRLDVARPAQNRTYLRRLMERFPSRVRSHLEPYQGTPLDELYDDLSGDSESE